MAAWLIDGAYQSTAGAKAGVLLMPIFANSSAGAPYVAADGQWLNNPDAALIGDVNNSDANEAVLLSLSNPMYDVANQVGCYRPLLECPVVRSMRC
jgi:hypothetical protein